MQIKVFKYSLKVSSLVKLDKFVVKQFWSQWKNWKKMSKKSLWRHWRTTNAQGGKYSKDQSLRNEVQELTQQLWLHNRSFANMTIIILRLTYMLIYNMTFKLLPSRSKVYFFTSWIWTELVTCSVTSITWQMWCLVIPRLNLKTYSFTSADSLRTLMNCNMSKAG